MLELCQRRTMDADVLEDDIQQSSAFAAKIAHRVFQRTAAAFQLSMREAIPQLQFDLRLRGRTVGDGVDVVFRQSGCNSDGHSVGGDQDGEYQDCTGMKLHSGRELTQRTAAASEQSLAGVPGSDNPNIHSIIHA